MSIIDFAELEKPIREIEKLLAEYNIEERLLILKQVNARLNAVIRDRQAKEVSNNVLGSIPLGGLLKKFKKDTEDDGTANR